jgi:hypothetical protein
LFPWVNNAYVLGQNGVYAAGTQPATVGTSGQQGGTSTFGSYSVAGGLGGQSGNYGGNSTAIPPGGANQGNLSTSGTNGAIVNFGYASNAPETYTGAVGGFGNNSNQSENSGHGGKGGGSYAWYDVHQMRCANPVSAPTAGNNGAVWLKLASYS